MIRLRSMASGLGVACLSLVCGSGVAAEAPRDRDLAAACMTCHGTDGHSAGGMKSLAGQSKADLLADLKGFRDGSKPATIMHQISKGYSDEQLDAMAAYFAKQPK
jgi:cytochrome c553